MTKNGYKMEAVIKRYNTIMFDLGYEHLTIGTQFSEDTDKWTLRDMVAECDNRLSTFYEWGHCNSEERSTPWGRACIGKLKRFIARFADDAKKLQCGCGHCSRRFDNRG